MENDKISKSILNWPYLDVVNKKDIRGFLISRMLIDDNMIYFMEIQRRVCNEETMNSFSEVEKFKGLVFTLDNECEIDKWVSLLAHESRFVKGILQKIVGKCPGTAMTYKHSPAKMNPLLVIAHCLMHCLKSELLLIILLMVISSPNISKLSGGQLIHLLEPAMISLSQRFILSPFLSMHIM